MTDPKTQTAENKTPLQLIPAALNESLALALKHGAEKYGPWNWRRSKVGMMTYIGAMRRHLDAFLEGEDCAHDSGISHLGHIAASCAIMLDAQKHGVLVDDRPQRINLETMMHDLLKLCPRCYNGAIIFYKRKGKQAKCRACKKKSSEYTT